VWVIVILVVAVVAVSLWRRTHPAEDATANMITAPVTRGSLIETVSATGSVTAQTGAEVKIGSQITGVIKRLYADVGSQVKAGQLIAELDLPDLRAQLNQAQASLALATTKLQQTESGVGMTDTQVREAVAQAQAGVTSAQAKLAAAQAASRQQIVQTPSDVRKAQTSLASAKAALSTAQSTLTQTEAGANLQVANAKEQLTQAQANSTNANLNLKRQQALLAKGFVAASVVDQAQATATVNQSLVGAAQQNVQLVQQKVTADLQTARDAVSQAKQNVAAAQASLSAARAETYTSAARIADVTDAQAAALQSTQSLRVATGNLAQITLKQQDVQQARDAVRQAQAQVAYNQAQLAKSYIRSPISGTVLQLAAQQGETLAAGLSAPTLIIVADLNRLQVDAFVDETDIGSVKIGQPAQVVVDAFPKHAFQGVVSKIASGSTIQNGVVTYDVTVSIKQDRRHQLKPDMTASVTIQTGEIDNALLVPSVAVQVGVHGSTVNTVVKKNGQTSIVPVRVQTGGTDGVNTEIRSGLTEGQTIVEAGASQGGGFRGPANPFGPQQRGGGRGGGGGGRRGG
jgi:RND family efflux transporter MFP subunit